MIKNLMSNRPMKRIGKILTFSVIYLMLAGCYFGLYKASEFEAKIVDADTGKPIEGVLVIVHWQRYEGSLVGGDVPGQEEIMETLSDKNGRVHFPGWGPRLTRVSDSSPKFKIFKSGYEMRWPQNRGNRHPYQKRKSDHHKKNIKLKKFKGTKKQYEKKVLDGLRGAIREATYDRDHSISQCNWIYIPISIATLHKEYAAHLGRVLNTKKIIGTYEGTGCGTTDKLRKHLQ